MTELRWTAADEAPTLAGIRAFVDEVARDLDPGSRYVTELRAVLDRAGSVEELLASLEDPGRVEGFRQDGSAASHGERGRSWVDGVTWEGMSVYERVLANLLTGETRMMWAGEGAADFARLGEVLAALPAPLRLLSVPCSTGKEPFSLAIAALRAQLRPEVIGVDRQPAYLERARSGQLVPHWRDLELPGVDAYLRWDDGLQRAIVAPEVLACCSFAQGDVLTGDLPAGRFGLVSCRNLLGYFRGDALAAAWRNVAARVAGGGVLLLDGFVTGAEEMALVPRLLAEHGFTRRFENANYYDAPATPWTED
ncbi:MAG: CheR family methyltransferase [Planctomycetota bacterium]